MDITKHIETSEVGEFDVETTQREAGWVVAVQWFGGGYQDIGVRVTEYPFPSGPGAEEQARTKHVEVSGRIKENPELWRLAALDSLVKQEQAAASEAFMSKLHATTGVEAADRLWESRLVMVRRAEWLKERADEDFDRARGVVPPNEEGHRAIGLTKGLMAKWMPGAGWLENLDDTFERPGHGVASSRFGKGPVDRIVVVPSSVEGVGHAASGLGRDGTLYMAFPESLSREAATRHLYWAVDAIRDLRREEMGRKNGAEWVRKNMDPADGRPTEVVVAGPATFVDGLYPHITEHAFLGTLKVSAEVPSRLGLGGATWRDVARTLREHCGRAESPGVER